MELNNWTEDKVYKLIDSRGIIKIVSLAMHGDSTNRPLIPYIDRTHRRVDGVILGHFYVCKEGVCFPIIGKNVMGRWIIDELEELESK